MGCGESSCDDDGTVKLDKTTEDLECMISRKRFKSLKQLQNHERSKTHIENLAALKGAFRNDDEQVERLGRQLGIDISFKKNQNGNVTSDTEGPSTGANKSGHAMKELPQVKHSKLSNRRKKIKKVKDPKQTPFLVYQIFNLVFLGFLCLVKICKSILNGPGNGSCQRLQAGGTPKSRPNGRGRAPATLPCPPSQLPLSIEFRPLQGDAVLTVSGVKGP